MWSVIGEFAMISSLIDDNFYYNVKKLSVSFVDLRSRKQLCRYGTFMFMLMFGPRWW